MSKLPLDCIESKTLCEIIKMVEDNTISRLSARQLIDAYIITGAVRKGYASGVIFNDDTRWFPDDEK